MIDMGTPSEGDLTGAKTITLEFSPGKITMDGQETDLAGALEAVIAASKESGGDAQAQFESGYTGADAERAPKPTANGRPMAGM